jgi:aromatic-L-amino-acid decarboxylase
MTPAEFRRLGHALIDWLADYRERVAEYPVMSQLEPGAVRGMLPAHPPEEGGGLDDPAKLLEPLLPGLTHWQHPRFFAYFPANSDLASVLGDLASSGLGQLGLNWQASPALTELEEQMCDWMRQLLGLPAKFKGVIQDTASTATLIALLCARERSTAYSQARGGLQAVAVPLVVYASQESHSSVVKAALLAGFGRDNVRLIETDKALALDAAALERAVQDDLERGKRPCALVATTGTTATTALDPVDAMARVAERYGLWLHVDGAMAGSAMLLPECRWMWRGIEGADSLVFNPHKWLGAVFDCSLFYVRDPQHLVRVMTTNPSYLQTAADEAATNYRDWGIALGRRFRALKLYFLLMAHGAQGLRRRLRRDLENAQWLKAQVEAADDWQLMAPVPLQTVCVRHVPPGMRDDELDAHNRAWASRLNASGEAYVTPAQVRGRWLVRVSIGALPTEREDVAALWAAMQREVDVGLR